MNENIIKKIKKNLSNEEIKNIEIFFEQLEKNCLLDNEEKDKIIKDFIDAIIYYINNNYTIEETLKLLDIKNIGTFYKDKIKTSYELDNYAKLILPLENKNYNHIFRITIHLNKNIIPELLQIALTFTIKRFPSFATKLKKNFFEYTLESCKKHYYIEEDNKENCRPINFKTKTTQLFRVLYSKNKLSLEISHILTDGYGGIFFLNYLLTEYLKLSERKLIIENENYNINEPIDKEEFENTFNKISTKDIKPNFKNNKLLTINGNKIKNEPYKIIEFKLDSTKLKNIAKKYNTTVTGYLTSAIFVANQAATNYKKGNTNVYIPINLRKYYKTKTIRNFSLFGNIYIKNKKNLTFSEIIENVDKQLKETLLPNKIIEIIANTNIIINISKYIPFVIKKLTYKLTSKIIYHNYYTNALSNLGVINFSDNISKYIINIDWHINMTAIAKILCSTITFNNTTSFSIFKNTQDTTFEKTLYKQFNHDNILIK